MKQFILIPIIILSVSLYTFSQTQYKVFAKKGDVVVNDSNSKRPVKTGETLSEVHTINLGDNSYLALYSAGNGAPIEITTAGEYKLSDIKPKSSVSLISKYTEFILSSNSPESKYNRLSATGAVHRGSAEKIKVFLPEPKLNHLIGDEFTIRWENKEHKQNETYYTIRLQDMMGEDIKKFSTNDTQIIISLKSLTHFSDKDLLVVVESGDKKSEEKSVVLANDKEKEKILTEIKQLEWELKDSKVLRSVIIAGAYEENGFILDANNEYLKAKQDSEISFVIEHFYTEFLERNKLK